MRERKGIEAIVKRIGMLYNGIIKKKASDTMTIEVIVNNYTLGAKVKTTPTDKIKIQQRLDKNHTLLRYENVTEREVQFIEKVIAKKAKLIK